MFAALPVIFAAGCASPGPRSLPICPGKTNAPEALSALAMHAEQAVSFRAGGGQCLLNYYAPDSDKPERHKLPMQLWFNPPSEVYIQGSIALDPKAVRIGSNEERFWVALRPKEMSRYYTGRWEEARNVEGLMVSPRVVLEAFGIIVTQGDEGSADRWSLKNEGPFDILTQMDEGGRLLKRVHIHACDYLVRKIEYFKRDGEILATAELSDYEPLSESFRVPTRVGVRAVGPEEREDSIRITLSSTKVMEFSQRLKDLIFNPPRDLDRYEEVYTYEEGKWVPER